MAERPTVAEALRQIPDLADLAPAAKRLLQARGVVREFAAGDALWHGGESPRGLFFLISGQIRILREGDDRTHLVHVAQTAGEILGEVPLFSDGGYPATAIAAAPTRCLALPTGDLAAVLAADPRLARRLLEGLAHRVRVLVDRLHRVTAGTVRDRLLERLRSGGVLADGRVLFRFTSQERLAEDLGTVREVVSREIGRLRDQGTVASRGRGCLEILDPGALDPPSS